MVDELINSEDEVQSPSDSLFDMEDLVLVQPLTTTVDEGGNQLSSPQTNKPAELSIPREIISEGVSTSNFQSELLRPIFAGTYRGTPAYLVRLQFQVSTPGNRRNWRSRIKTAGINVLLQDAPRDTGGEDSTDDEDDEPLHPSVVKTFPGEEPWNGTPSTAEVTEHGEIGLQLGWNSVSASTKVGRSQTKTETGAVEVMSRRKGRQRNSLLVTVSENAVDAAGIPRYLTIPLIITHHTRRFSMGVSVNARYGFWQDRLSEMVPVIGRADEPLYFDPLVMRRIMEKGQKGIGGVRVVQWGGELKDVDLRNYCSLTAKSE